VELETLRDLYIEGLKDLYSAENQIIKALPKMIKKASHPELKRAFTLHLKETERQATRLERICRDLGESPKGKKCVGMEGLIKEAKELIEERPDPDVLDAGLIAAAQHVEHYEMAGYGTMRTYARQLGYESHADQLQQTLDEEGNTDHLLTELAERSINIDAESQDDASTRRFGRTSGPAKKGGRKSAAKKGGRKTAAKKGGARKKSGARRR
jgi:ferritin-like metal-binding protein YciE